MHLPLPALLVNTLDLSLNENGKPAPADISVALPSGSAAVVHYGIMIPSLPAPHHFLDIIAVVGQPNIKIFANPQLITTTPLDTATILIGTGSEQDNFAGYSIANDCVLHEHNGALHLRFGQDVEITGQYPHFTAQRSGHSFNFKLALTASDKIAHFAKIIFNQYDHWSILCQYQGQIEHHGQTIDVSGLCTFEYARGTSLSLPFRFFSYQILNIDTTTQVLLVEVLGPLGAPVQRRVYVRSLDAHCQVYSRDFQFTVHDYLPNPAMTPTGVAMKLPKTFTWSVNDEDGGELIHVEGTSNNDFCYGMAAGYAGSYSYHGRFKGQRISGDGGYIENIDYR